MLKQGVTAVGLMWLVLAGCGGDDGGNGDTSPNMIPPSNTIPAGQQTPMTTPAAGVGDSGGVAAPNSGAMPSGLSGAGGMMAGSSGVGPMGGGMSPAADSEGMGPATSGGGDMTGTDAPVDMMDSGPAGMMGGGMTLPGEPEEPAAGGGDADPGNCKWARGDMPTEQSATTNGPYNVETYSQGFATASGVTSNTVHYPTDAEPPFAGVAVVPGFVSPESSIQRWGPFLASHGIVTVTIGVPGGDQPDARATKLMGTLEALKKEDTRSGSPLEGKLAVGCMGVSGWSMGGGGTLIAASGNPDLKAGVSFAAWGPRGGAQNKVPVLMFEATADILAASMSDGFYSQTPDSTPKMLFEVQGSSHNVANSPTNHDGIIGRYGLSWWKIFLEGDERYRSIIDGGFPSITTSKSAHNLK